MMTIEHDKVVELMREAAAREIMPLWRNLEQHHVMEKGVGDVVTAADQACEAFLADELTALIPGSLLVGEESYAADPGVLGALKSDRPVWVVDPLDGTRNFARHEPPIAVMVCLVQANQTLASWILDPLEDTVLSAERGAGAWLEGQRLQVPSAEKPVNQMNGAVMVRYLPEDLRDYALSMRDRLGGAVGTGCAGHDYRLLATGQVDFLFYYRTLVWDHAPGVLIIEEAGGWARRYDGQRYLPDSDALGLICSNSSVGWQKVRDTVLPAEV